MLKQILISIWFIFIILSCDTMKPKNDIEETIKRDDPKSKVTVYGEDNEVQSIDIAGRTYYVLGSKDLEKMTEQEIRANSIMSPLKVIEETVEGVKGIIITYYDVKIFLGRNSGFGAKVGIFEPQKNAWTIGYDIDRTLAIQIKLTGRNIAGPIDIKRGSISLAFN